MAITTDIYKNVSEATNGTNGLSLKVDVEDNATKDGSRTVLIYTTGSFGDLTPFIKLGHIIADKGYHVVFFTHADHVVKLPRRFENIGFNSSWRTGTIYCATVLSGISYDGKAFYNDDRVHQAATLTLYNLPYKTLKVAIVCATSPNTDWLTHRYKCRVATVEVFPGSEIETLASLKSEGAQTVMAKVSELGTISNAARREALESFKLKNVKEVNKTVRRHLIATTKEFCSNQPPESVLCGPLSISTGFVDADDALLAWVSRKPTVLLTFGSMAISGMASMFGRILTAISALREYQVLINLAEMKASFPEEECRLHCEQIRLDHRIVDYINYINIMPRMAFVITHGGAGSCHNALLSGCPLLVWPIFGDQFLNASIIEDHGWGLGHHSLFFKYDEIDTMFSSMAKRRLEFARNIRTREPPNNTNDVVEDWLTKDVGL